MKIKIIFLLFIIAVIYSTCTNTAYNPDICFQENVLPVFVSKCSMNGCHNTAEHKGGYDLSNYDGIMNGVKANHPLESKVYTSIRGSNPSMPRGFSLPQKDISYIKIWIEMGAQNSSNCTTCDSTKYSYTGRIEPIISNWCVGCHNTGNAGGGYDYTSYGGLVASITNHRLLGSLNHLTGYSGMPKNTNQLSACDINAITKWVNGGYANN